MRQYVAVTLLIAVSPVITAADPALKAAEAFYDGVRVETLANGLQVVLKPVPGSPVVTTMVAYKVGSGDEELSATGLSHYLEHLMFKGTAQLMPGDIDRQTQRNGGHNNAWTNEDLTTYHFDFAADRWEVALSVEADRMRNLRIDDRHEFQQEKGAVIAELDGNEDNSFELENKAILPRLFGATSPYGHPVIGEREHVRQATAGVIKAHYDRWYHPNNAVLVICGGFDPDRALALVREKFGPIPAGKLPERRTAIPETRTGPVRHEFDSKFEEPRMVMGFATVANGDPNEHALAVIPSLLSGGKTGRLYQTLVEDKRLATIARAGHHPGRYPGWFSVEVEMLPNKSKEEAEKYVLDELKRLALEPVGDEELQRAKRLLLAGEVFAREGVHELAESLAIGVALRGLNPLREYLPKIAAVTPADVQRAVKKFLDPNLRVVVWSNPKSDASPTVPKNPPKKPGRADRPSATIGGGYDLQATQRVALPNGLTLLLLENHRLPIVSARAYVRNVRLSEPAALAGVASLTGSLLDEGTATKSGREIARLIENVGGELSMNPAGGSVKVLASDFPLALNLLLDCLTQPSFPVEAFDRLREQSQVALEDADHQPETKAELVFLDLVYGEHPLGRPMLGRKESLAKLTPESCKQFHGENFVPNRTALAIIGDFDPETVRAEIERRTVDWKPRESAAPVCPTVKRPDASRERIVTMPDAAQLYFYLGHPGIRRSDPDYYKLLVMDYVLGTGSGFTDRLSAKLRDRMGLAYTVSATITNNAGDEPGTFTCYIGTYPDKFNVVKAAFIAEIRKIRDEPPTAQEVEDAKRYLIGSIAFRFTTSDQVGEQILQIERFRLGFGYLDEFRRQVAAVTPADIQAVARKHLDPDHMILVAAGALTETGKPLKPGRR